MVKFITRLLTAFWQVYHGKRGLGVDLIDRRLCRICKGVIAFVGEEFLDAGDQADAFLRDDAIGGVARRQDQHPRAEKRIDDRVDFAVAAAFREPDRLKFGPPFPPLAQR